MPKDKRQYEDADEDKNEPFNKRGSFIEQMAQAGVGEAALAGIMSRWLGRLALLGSLRCTVAFAPVAIVARGRFVR